MSGRVVIVGGGGVLGQALSNEFAAAGHEVMVLRRAAYGPANPKSQLLACDLGDPAQVHRTVAGISREQGPIDVLIHNAIQFKSAAFQELSVGDFEDAWLVGVAGAVAAAKAALPGMLLARRGTILFSGATAALRGSARWATLATAKFALRGLAQSLGREYQPLGVHVAHVVIDGLLKGSRSFRRFGGVEENAIDPADAARAYRWLAEQPRSAWTHEIDIRPYNEKF